MDVKSFILGFEKGREEAHDPQVDKYFSGEPAFLTLPYATQIKEYAFADEEWGHGNLVGISMPKVNEIKETAFAYCSGLETVDMPNLTRIGYGAFEGCENLALTQLPNGVTWISGNAFFRCKGVAITEIPSSVVVIESGAFSYCTGLKTITFKGNPLIYPGAFTGCTDLTVINVPWSEDENSPYYPPPWGATNATINYNYTGD